MVNGKWPVPPGDPKALYTLSHQHIHTLVTVSYIVATAALGCTDRGDGPINHPTPILSQKTLYNKTINIDRHIYITIQGFLTFPVWVLLV